MSNEVTVFEQKIEQLKQAVPKKISLLKWGGLGLAAVVVAPVIWSGVVGATGIIALAAVGIAGTQFLPVLARWSVNKKTELLIAEQMRHIEAIKAQARKNPIETLQAQAQDQEAALEIVRGKIERFAQKVSTYDSKLSMFKKQWPSDAPIFEQTSRDMRELLERRKAKFQEARSKLQLFYKEIERADAMWQMGLATSEIRESAGDLDDNFMKRLRRETALDAVQEQLAKARADLEMMMMEEVDIRPPAERTPQLENNASEIIEPTYVRNVAAVPARRPQE